MAERLRAWFRRHIPSRETIDSYRILRPFATQLRHPELWHLNAKSVPRGVALGLGVGVIIPFLHVVLAMLLAIPVRANVVVAGAFTLVVNPITIPPMYYAAYRIGSWELHHEAIADPAVAQEGASELGRMLFWLHHASGPIALGILTISLGAAIGGYVLSALGWRLWSAYRGRDPGSAPAD
jgi:uncharacterized protein (DUF2062 family)